MFYNRLLPKGLKISPRLQKDSNEKLYFISMESLTLLPRNLSARFDFSAKCCRLELYPHFKSQPMIHESSWCHQVDGIKSLWSLSHGKPLTYLPWLELSGSLPIYPTIFNATTTRITWDFKRKKHKVYAFPARWKFIDAYGPPNNTIERKYYQFCRDKVKSSNLGTR